MISGQHHPIIILLAIQMHDKLLAIASVYGNADMRSIDLTIRIGASSPQLEASLETSRDSYTLRTNFGMRDPGGNFAGFEFFSYVSYRKPCNDGFKGSMDHFS